jgi:hypothetical protein
MKHALAPSSFALLLALSSAASAEVVGTPGVPSGFGLAGNVWGLSISGAYGPERNPPEDTERFDGSGSVLFGFGNPAAAVGVQGGLVVVQKDAPVELEVGGEKPEELGLGLNPDAAVIVVGIVEITAVGVLAVHVSGLKLETSADIDSLDPGIFRVFVECAGFAL